MNNLKNATGDIIDMTTDNSSSFKYKSSLLTGLVTEDGGASANSNRIIKNAQILVSLKYISSFVRLAEIPLINTKLHLELSWTKNSLTNNVAGDSKFQITKTELHVPVAILNTDDNLRLTKLLNKGFKKSVLWNEYISKIETHTLDNNNLKRISLDSSFQGVNRSFALAYGKDGVNQIEMDSHSRFISPRLELTKFNVLIDGRNFYDQPISDKIWKYDELRKIRTGKGDNCSTACLLDYDNYLKHYLVTACGLSKQKTLDADLKSIQELQCVFMLSANAQILIILEK